MSNSEKGSEESSTSTRGADWEVVNLTASTYAAAPGPGSEHEPSSAMFMSDLSVFPPSEHENLPIEPDYNEIHSEFEDQDVSAVKEDGGPDMSDETISHSKFDDDKQNIQFFDKGHGLSVDDAEVEVGKGLPVTNLIEEVGSMDDAHEPSVVTHKKIRSPKHTKENDGDECDGSSLPSVAWWKRHVACLYQHAKDANTFWSVVVAAALVGLVILGSSSKKHRIFSN